MKARGRVLLLFRGIWIPLMKPEARVFDVVSQTN